MSLIKCPECRRKISNHSTVCPHCGCPLNDTSIAQQQQTERMEKHKKTRSVLKACAVGSSIVCGIAVLVLLFYFAIIPAAKYHHATSLMEAGCFDEAIAGFEELGDYKDCADQIAACYCGDAATQLDAGNYDRAILLFEKSGIQNKSNIRPQYQYAQGMRALKQQQYEDAIDYLEQAQKDNKKAAEILPDIRLKYVKKLLEAGDPDLAEIHIRKIEPQDDTIDYYLTACELVRVEQEFWSGNLNTAKQLYQQLPLDYTYNGICVGDRLQFLDDHAYMVNACGKWQATGAMLTCRVNYESEHNRDTWKAKHPDDTDGKEYFIELHCIPSKTLDQWTICGTATLPVYQMGTYWPNIITKSETVKSPECNIYIGSNFGIFTDCFMTIYEDSISLIYTDYSGIVGIKSSKCETTAAFKSKLEDY